MSVATRKDLLNGLLSLVDKATDKDRLAKSIAAYLVAERRTKDLGGIMRALEQLRFDQDGVLEIQATSAKPLSDVAKRQIKELFTAKYSLIHEVHDEQLVGGVKLRALDKAVDYSVQAKLQQLRGRIA